MKPLLRFPNPAVYTRDRLREALELAGRADVTVSTKPTTGADEHRPRPYVQVMSLGGETLRGIRADEGIRLLVNDPDEGAAYDTAELCRALLVHLGVVTTSGGSARPSTTTDPDTGEPLATVDLDVVTAPS
ncbi:tail terminator [Microbacterium phage Zeta1847]|uniref:Tail terminator n=1 Tax=Microbacterium phage Zeta1847 TaxID=2201444 RepID=A0A2Z4Q9G6_9CAUD|nr:tail terminator [Microbacterium phage Zeta1847]AWY06644.1 tail terminator [Microbacterium phage Zeta1847]